MSPCSDLAGDRRGGENRVTTCSVPSPAPALSPSSASPRRKTIEDVWRDISLSFLRDRDPIAVPAAILQDLVSGPFQRSPWLSSGARDLSPSPATCLRLTSVCPEATTGPRSALRVAMDASNSHCGKRGPEAKDEPPDRKHKRLIKNRESAARSRARRQAYTTELEIEIERLRQENANLRLQQLQFVSTATASDLMPKKSKLHRTLTVPF